MSSIITKIWLFILIASVLALSLVFSIFLFAAALILAAIVIPYIYYVKWKAKKKIEEIEKEWIEAEYTCETEKQLKDRF